MKVIFAILTLGLGVFVNAQNDALFAEANTLYNDGKYAEAIEKYEAILQSNQHSVALYFNLANAHYKLDNIAPSIYYFEKALLLDPNDEQIKNNLGFARNMTIDAIDTVPEVGFSRIYKNVINSLSAERWAIIAVISVFVFVILFMWYYFSEVTTQKRIAFLLIIIVLLTVFFTVFMAFQKHRLDKRNNLAIVFAQESRVKADPNKISEEVFRLHEGTKVQVIESYEDWYKIEIADKTRGWISSEDIKLLNDF